MFVGSDEDQKEIKSDFPQLGTFADLGSMGITIEHTSRGIACTELCHKLPFALEWDNSERTNVEKARKFGEGNYRYVFGDGFFMDDYPRFFSIRYLPIAP